MPVKTHRRTILPTCRRRFVWHRAAGFQNRSKPNPRFQNRNLKRRNDQLCPNGELRQRTRADWEHQTIDFLVSEAVHEGALRVFFQWKSGTVGKRRHFSPTIWEASAYRKLGIRFSQKERTVNRALFGSPVLRLRPAPQARSPALHPLTCGNRCG